MNYEPFVHLPTSSGLRYWSDFRSLIAPYVNDNQRVNTFPGYYEESLTPELKSHLMADSVSAGLVTFDCDLSASFETSLTFAASFFRRGTLIYIDDWRNVSFGNPAMGIQGVWSRFVSETKLPIAPFLSVGWWGASFVVHSDPAL